MLEHDCGSLLRKFAVENNKSFLAIRKAVWFLRNCKEKERIDSVAYSGSSEMLLKSRRNSSDRHRERSHALLLP
jgi:hypothetical protein